MGKKKVPRWLLGCGLVFVLGVLTVIVLVTVGVLGLRDVIGEFEVADATMETVEERFGPIPAFHAEPAGAIPQERIEAFLTARAAVEEPRRRTEDALALLSNESDVYFAGFRRLNAGAQLLHRVAGFVQARNQALLDAEMGLGEYYYLYSLAYLSWLRVPLDDGPSFELVGESGYVMETAFTGEDEAAVRERREQWTRASLNANLLPVLQQQRAAIDESVAPAPGWKEALAAEIARLEADPLRIPWEDGLPPVIKISLEPYRDRLETSYSPMCNALELGLARR